MNTVITIGRQFGSGGREIGEKLAEHFGIKCYDKELLSRAAKDSGFCEEMIKTHDERPTNSFLYNLVMDTYSFGYNTSTFMDMPISHKVFLAQFDASPVKICNPCSRAGIIYSRLSLTALGLPGRLTIKVPFRIPAAARLNMALGVIVIL